MSNETFEQVVAALEPWRRMHRRDAWRPVIRDGAAGASQFGGVPLLPPREPWPVCRGCARPLQLFVQLDLETLPAALNFSQRSGLFQLFYCTDDDCEDALTAWDPAATGAKLVRVIAHERAAAPAAPPPGFEPFPRRVVAGWERFDDYPHPTETDELGLSFAYDHSRTGDGVLHTSVSWPEGGVHFDLVRDRTDGPGLAEAVTMAETKDKLGGWPHWIQNVEYPSCPRCGTRMRHLLQIDSEDNVPFMFGDVGTGHVTQCPTHPDVVAFGWACS